MYFLPVTGRVTDGEKKLSGCLVKVYQGNELVQEDRPTAGRFDLELDLGRNTPWSSREGFLPKRVVVDTRTEIPVEARLRPLAMDVNLMIGSSTGR